MKDLLKIFDRKITLIIAFGLFALFVGVNFGYIIDGVNGLELSLNKYIKNKVFIG